MVAVARNRGAGGPAEKGSTSHARRGIVDPMSATWSVREIPELESTSSPGSWMLHGFVEATNAVLLDAWGTHDYDRTAHELLGSLQDQRYIRKIRLVVVADGAAEEAGSVVGYVALNLPLQDNTDTAVLELGVLPGHRRHGIGALLHDAALKVVAEAGRSTIQVSTDQRTEPAEGPDTLTPTTGEGRVRASDASTRFATKNGYQLEQVARFSVFELPFDPEFIENHRRAAQEHAGPDYRLVTWQDHCPDEWLDHYALLATRMSTDAPSGGLDIEEDVWDGARVRATEQQFEERGLGMLVLAAEHVPTHTLAAFTEFMTLPNSDEFLYQNDTLVLREHRGKHLGMLVKAANLQRLAAERPAVRRIGTWNAEENSYMLAINVTLGFRPAGGAGEWQLKL